MNTKCFIWAALALGFTLVEGCNTPHNSSKPWDQTPSVDSRPGSESPNDPGVNSDTKE